ncbi:MAG: DUF6328 family protein [Nocardioidaceae bacterium]
MTNAGGPGPGSDSRADPGPPERESEAERLTRNVSELLQELRVTQTGVQILTGFLLTLPFSQRFADLDELQRTVYLAVLCGSVLATGFIVAPVAFHRVLFRNGERPWLVAAANRCALAGLTALGLTTAGMVWLVFSLVSGRTPAHVAGAACLVFLAGLWAAVPLALRPDRDDAGRAGSERPSR